jgi:hypothetical protein
VSENVPPVKRPVVGAESIIDAAREHIWMLRLSCGHFFYCPSVFKPGREPPTPPVTPPRFDELLPPPKAADCLECGRAKAGLPPKYDPHLSPEMAKALADHAAKLRPGQTAGGILVAKVGPPDEVIYEGPNVVVPADSPAGKDALAGAGGPPGPLGTTAEGVHVVTCPDCRGIRSDCNACGGTGTLPPVLPGRLTSDHVVGYWFACDGAYDNFVTIVCRGPAWVGLIKERRHDTPWKMGIFHPARTFTTDQVIEQHNRQQAGHLENESLVNFDSTKRWGTFVDVRSADPSRIASRFKTFMSLVGAHVLPEDIL